MLPLAAAMVMAVTSRPIAGQAFPDALRNAPAQREQMVSVPKVVE